jgi:hypothetical protein
MARTSFVDLDTATEEKYFGQLNSGDRFTIPRVTMKWLHATRKAKKGLNAKTLLPEISSRWAALSGAEKLAWSSAAAYSSLNGWRLFVADNSLRIKNDIAGVATPSVFHQSLVGQLHLEGSHPWLKLIQPHPSDYWISRKVTGKKGMYEPVLFTERLILPLMIGLSYKSDLTVTDGDGYARMYAVVRRLYQGRNIDTLLTIELDLSSDWQTVTATLSSVLGQYTQYVLYLDCYHVTGDLWIDNVKAVHSSQNWLRDPLCNDINEAFTKAFYQVPKHWTATEITAGCWYESVYLL